MERSPMAVGGRRDSPEAGEVSLVALLNVVLRNRAIVLGTALALAAVVAAAVLVAPRAYRATATFMEQSRKSSVSAAGLAAQLGLSLPGTDGSQTPQFYVDLLTSRSILGPLVDGQYRVATPRGAREGNLVALFEATGATPTLRREAAIELLDKAITATISAQTGVVTVHVDSEHADLSHQIAARALELINRFNLERRQSQAGVELRFTERRLAEARQELRAAEARAEAFLEQNRAYKNSPSLNVDYERLSREVGLRQSVFTTVAQALEQAKVDAIRDTPVITVIEAPEIPVRPRPRGLLRWTLVSLVAGLVIGIVAAFGREYASRAGAESGAELNEFRALKADALGDVRRPWRPIQRLLRRSPAAR